ncbi:MAG: hypothetical protein M3Z08_23525, partial [Chloroflexota bacterium]|nr:hypothetical protein [Chloroflexota bacterium]
MRTQPIMAEELVADIPALLTKQRRSDLLLFTCIFITVISITPLLVLAGMSVGFGLVVGGVAALLIAALVIRRPVTGFYMMAACVVLIDQAPLFTPVLTDRLYIFYWPTQLEGLIDRPIGFFALFVVLMLVCHNLVKRRKVLQGNALLLPFVLYLLCVVVGVVHGMTSGGDLKIIVLEIRPFWYMFLSYMLAYNLVTRKEHIRSFLWIVILGAGVKALQGVYIYLIVLKGSLLGHR